MTPDDVYALVDARTMRTHVMLVVVGTVLSILIAAQIVAKVFIWRKVVVLLRETKVLVRIAQAHGSVNDRQTARAESLVAQAKEVAERAVPNRTLVEAVRTIPDATANRVIERLHEDGSTPRPDR